MDWRPASVEKFSNCFEIQEMALSSSAPPTSVKRSKLLKRLFVSPVRTQ